jgi:Outer membrane protein beta-barrel domain
LTNPDCGLRSVTNPAAILPLAPTGMQKVVALTALLFLACAGFAQQAPAPWSDAQSARGAHQATSEPATHTAAAGPPQWGIFAGYASIESNNHNFHFNPGITAFDLDYDEHGRGFEIGVVRNLNRYFGIVGLFDAHFSSNHIANFVPNCAHPPCAVETLDINPSLFRFTAGPEVAFRNHTRVTPFADVLFGLAHSHAFFHLSEAAGRFTSTEGENGFAINFAAGLEVRVVRDFSFRGSIDYGKAFVGSSALPSQLVDSVGFSTGLLFRFH